MGGDWGPCAIMPVPAGVFSNHNQAVRAIGGTISTPPGGNWTVHSYTATGAATFNVYKGIAPIEYLVIGGGGGSGGSHDDVVITAGGGAGGYRSSVQGENTGGGLPAETPLSLAEGIYSVSVGAGGAGGAGGLTLGANGANSVFHTITATGGGRGGANPNPTGADGGSGGGGSPGNGASGLGGSGQGFAGGRGSNYGTTNNGAGGGGGASSRGLPGTTTAQFTKASVAVATTENISLVAPPAVVDGITLTTNMRVLVKNQGTSSENGIYVFDGVSMTRATDMDTSGEALIGSYVNVSGGSTQAGNWAVSATSDIITLGSSPINWVLSTQAPPRGGDGGAGITSSITGTPIGRGGGGGGSGAITAGVGVDGGATGRTGVASAVGGTANTGGGAGGSAFFSTDGALASRSGATGGSGVVIVRYWR